MYCKFDDMAKLDCELDEFDNLDCKFDESWITWG